MTAALRVKKRRLERVFFFSVRLFVITFCILVLVVAVIKGATADQLLIAMDDTQRNHLKAYGVAYWCLEKGLTVHWLLNYRGGSFLVQGSADALHHSRIKGVTIQEVSDSEVSRIYGDIEKNNMNDILLEKATKIAVYSPPFTQPWDDAVTLVLEYADIPYDKIWDREVLTGQLSKYDWLHLHHEDFTGQYGKFYRSFNKVDWYIKQKEFFEKNARELGFEKVSDEKKIVAEEIRRYVLGGGFLFAMCSATETIDIALAAREVDIAQAEFDGDGVSPDAQKRLDFSRTFTFENFTLIFDPLVYGFSDIDVTPTRNKNIQGAWPDYFTLFEFSAKYDPVPTMLTQNHEFIIKGFLGQTTAFKRGLVKKSVVIMGDVEGEDIVKYIHGTIGKGTFTFYGGHDPEDYRHFVNDPPTQLSLFKNSPGYRLILNNILFPGAEKKELKT